MKTLKLIVIGILLLSLQGETMAYPYDGYSLTGIRRLLRLQLIMEGIIKESLPVLGAQKSISEIYLNLQNEKGDSLEIFPVADPALQKSISALFPNMDESYSLCLLDITPESSEICQPARQALFYAGQRGQACRYCRLI